MSFFERPVGPTARVARAVVASPPAWLGPPHNVLPGIALMELIVARTDQTVVAIASIQAYPAGFGFTLSLRLRTVSAREDQQLPHLCGPVFEQTRCPMSSCALMCSSPTVVKPPTWTALRSGGPTARSTGAEPARWGRRRLGLGSRVLGVAAATGRAVRLRV
jgi:hypothetical protein